MARALLAIVTIIAAFSAASATLAASAPGGNSGALQDDLPESIERLTSFGERASWSPDNRSIAFMSKSFGDAFVVDVATKQIRLLTGYQHAGYLRVQYLPNGDFVLIGARKFEDIHKTRYHDQELWILNADGRGQPVPLNQKVSEGIAISRKAMKVAWAIDWRTSPEELAEGESAIYTADVVYEGGQPRLANRKRVLKAKLPECRLEAQDFRQEDNELVYVCYRETTALRLADVYGLDLRTGRTTVYRKVQNEYNEAEGIFPNGEYTLVESDRDQPAPKGSKTLDIWKLRLEPNSSDFKRVTRFGDRSGYKASNPVVSSDGRTIAFQEGRSSDPAGVGYGIFLLTVK
jgi:hypothetical protein